jgi:uncharacterized protein YjaG (DUF416 family)
MNWYKQSQVSGNDIASRAYQNYLDKIKDLDMRSLILRNLNGIEVKDINISTRLKQDYFEPYIEIIILIPVDIIQDTTDKWYKYRRTVQMKEKLNLYLKQATENIKEEIKKNIGIYPVIKVKGEPTHEARLRIPSKNVESLK